jgi:hypothetical protein
MKVLLLIKDVNYMSVTHIISVAKTLPQTSIIISILLIFIASEALR